MVDAIPKGPGNAPGGQTVNVVANPQQIPFIPGAPATLLNNDQALTIEVSPNLDFSQHVVPLLPGAQISWPNAPLYARLAGVAVTSSLAAQLTVINGVQTYFAGSIQTVGLNSILFQGNVAAITVAGPTQTFRIPALKVPQNISTLIIEIQIPGNTVPPQECNLFLFGNQTGITYASRPAQILFRNTAFPGSYLSCTWIVPIPTAIDTDYFVDMVPTGVAAPLGTPAFVSISGTSDSLTEGGLLYGGTAGAVPPNQLMRSDGYPYPKGDHGANLLVATASTQQLIPAPGAGFRLLIASAVLSANQPTGATYNVQLGGINFQPGLLFISGIGPQFVPPQGMLLDENTNVTIQVVAAGNQVVGYMTYDIVPSKPNPS